MFADVRLVGFSPPFSKEVFVSTEYASTSLLLPDRSVKKG